MNGLRVFEFAEFLRFGGRLVADLAEPFAKCVNIKQEKEYFFNLRCQNMSCKQVKELDSYPHWHFYSWTVR